MSLSIDRVTLLKYFKYLDEAKVIRCLYTEMDKISDLQKPDKLLMDNTNLLYCSQMANLRQEPRERRSSVINWPPPDTRLSTEDLKQEISE